MQPWLPPSAPLHLTPYLTFPPYRPVFQWSWEACPKSVPLGLLLLFPLLAGITPTLQVLGATSPPGGLSWFLTWEISRPPNSSWPLPVWILSVGVPGTSHWIRQTQLLDSPKPAPSKVSSIPVNRITPFDGFVSKPHPWLPLPHIPSSKPSASLGILPPKSVLNLALSHVIFPGPDENMETQSWSLNQSLLPESDGTVCLTNLKLYDFKANTPFSPRFSVNREFT